jgi:hypothetical protein
VRLLTGTGCTWTHRYKVEVLDERDDLVDVAGRQRDGAARAGTTGRWKAFRPATCGSRPVDTTQDRDAVSVSELEVYGSRVLDLPKPALSTTNVNVREGGEGRFFVRLDKEPDSPVMVTREPESGSTNVTILSGSSRSFKASNWDLWQVVTLVAPEDADAIGETAVFRVSVPGADDQFVNVPRCWTTRSGEPGAGLGRSHGDVVGGASRAAQLIDGVHTVSTNYGLTLWTNVPAGTITLDLKRVAVSRIRC